MPNLHMIPFTDPPQRLPKPLPHTLISCTLAKPNPLDVSNQALAHSVPLPLTLPTSPHIAHVLQLLPAHTEYARILYTSLKIQLRHGLHWSLCHPVPLPSTLTCSLTSLTQHTVSWVILVPLDHELLEGKYLYKAFLISDL